MHICIDFVPKLLSHSDLNKQVQFINVYLMLIHKMSLVCVQVFAIHLISALCEKYPIVRTFNVAKLAINVITTLLQGK